MSAAPKDEGARQTLHSLRNSKAALGGERKQVTVLFCDPAKSTVLAERIGPDAMIIALFGAPVAHEDHAAGATLRFREVAP